MRRRLIALFVVELAVFFCGMMATRYWVPIDEHPFIHICGVILSGGVAVVVGLIAARRMDLL